ncbi:uncharacterized protein LOC118512358 [Anopheles stephensi]|uniref:uncharacterized protein LOC118512358 n=1 Tax=Anopheles stephensi TaxID=30069 RepID=UPI001658828D|nr:uncharacterized protein LOC118512358 [Anopheles stephensi]
MQKSPSNHLDLESNDFDHLFHSLTLPQPHQLHKEFQGIYSYDSNRACSLETLYLNLLISQSTSPSSRLLHKLNGCHGQPHNSWCKKASAAMVRITEQLIRKKAEHNELIIGTLEELSLHQVRSDPKGRFRPVPKSFCDSGLVFDSALRIPVLLQMYVVHTVLRYLLSSLSLPDGCLVV